MYEKVVYFPHSSKVLWKELQVWVLDQRCSTPDPDSRWPAGFWFLSHWLLMTSVGSQLSWQMFTNLYEYFLRIHLPRSQKWYVPFSWWPPRNCKTHRPPPLWRCTARTTQNPQNPWGSAPLYGCIMEAVPPVYDLLQLFTHFLCSL